MTHGELFAGISGFGLGFSRAGIKTLWRVEIDPDCPARGCGAWPALAAFQRKEGNGGPVVSEFLKRLHKWAAGWLTGGPHFVVGDPSRPYLLRWYVLPRNDWFNVYIHRFLRDDDDRAMHDHPWASVSLLLRGRYVEETAAGRKEYRAGSLVWRSAEYTHRVELPGGRPCWTLFVTGRRVREWGFHCPQGWVHWRVFTAPNAPGEIGRGCGETAEGGGLS